jgi:hypothetical protein
VHVVFGGLGLGLTAFLLAVGLVDTDEAHRQILIIFLAPLMGLSVVYFLPSFAGGLGLLRGIYWARGLLWIEAAFLAPLVPVGAILSGLTLWALLPRKGEIPSDGGIAKFEQLLLRWRRAAVLAIAALATLGAIVGLGYIFRDQIEALDPQPKQELTPLPDFDKAIPKVPDGPRIPDYTPDYTLPGNGPDNRPPSSPSPGPER